MFEIPQKIMQNLHMWWEHSIPKTERSISMCWGEGTIPGPVDANTSLQVWNNLCPGDIFLRRCLLFFLDLLVVVFVSSRSSRNSLPFLSDKFLPIPIWIDCRIYSPKIKTLAHDWIWSQNYWNIGGWNTIMGNGYGRKVRKNCKKKKKTEKNRGEIVRF